MTTKPMQGIRVVEVAQYTFTPSAGAILADWGADVIKVEHAVTGDAQRGLQIGVGGVRSGAFQPLMEHPNRGKRSVGLALETKEGRTALSALVKEADVFLTNFLPSARRKLQIDVDDIRGTNPTIIYARGSALGPRGSEAEVGGFDGNVFWTRGSGAAGATPVDSPRMVHMPAPAFGDSLGGMALAGAISAALFARLRSGETSIVDVSLLGLAVWANGLSVANGIITGEFIAAPPLDGPPNNPVNPLIGDFPTGDGRWITLTMMQPGRYWAEVCSILGREELVQDPRFATAESLIAHANEAGKELSATFRTRSLAHWAEAFRTFSGQWAVGQTPLELARDPQVLDNEYVVDVIDADGKVQKLASSPAQFDETAQSSRRAPTFAEHTDEILLESGYDMDRLIQAKLEGGIA